MIHYLKKQLYGLIKKDARIFDDIQEIETSLLAEMLDVAPNSITVHDFSGRFLYANQKTFEIHGYSRKEFLDLNLQSLDVPESSGLIQERIKAIQKNGHAKFEVEHYRKDGTKIPLEVYVKLVDWKGTQAMLSIATDISERRIIEQFQNKYKQIISSTPNLLALVDRDYRYTIVNKAFETYSNLAKEKLIGMHAAEYLGEEVFENEVKPNLEKCLKGETINYQMWVDYPTLGKRFMDITYFPLYVDNEIIEGVVAIIKDSTDLKLLQNSLIDAKEQAEESEEKYRALYFNAPLAYQSLDEEGRFIDVNPMWLKILGYEKEEVIGKWFGDFLHPDFIDHYKVNFPAFKKRGYVSDVQFKLRKKDNTYVYISFEGCIGYTADGKFKQTYCVFKDITQQKIAEKEIALNNERLESLLKLSQFQTDSIQKLIDYALDEAIKLTASQIGYIYFYDERKRQFSLNSWSKEVMKDCTVMNPQTIYDLDKTGCWGEAVRQRKPIMINDYAAESDIKRGTPEGHVTLKKFLTIPVVFENKIVAVVGVANKETDYNDSDTRQLTLLMDSVWKMSERLLLIDDLQSSKERAEKANRLKTEFLNNMSHEIRTPMNGIMGFSDLLNKPGISDEKRTTYTKIIQNSSQQLLRIIDDILEISTLETKQDTLNEEILCLNDFLMELFSIFNLQSKERGLPLYIKKALSDSDSSIVTDRAKLNKIMSNLLENALKYTDDGFIEMGYTINENSLIIYVKDTGIGISPKNHQLVFERFSQEDKEISRKHGGLGLGLSISQENAHLLGGNITIASDKGKGSTFFVNLPYKPSKNETAIPADTSDISKSTATKGSCTILVAEDEEVNYLYIEALFLEEGKMNCNMIHAKNGKEAVEICMNNEKIDLILMDIKMPVMNGHQATAEIKSMFPKLPVIAQTAYSSDSDKDLAFKHGCDDFISKPLNKEKLFGLIAKHMGWK